MKRKPPDKNRGKSPAPGPASMPPMTDQRALEKMMWEVNRLIEERGLRSEKEINAFLQELMSSESPPESEKVTPLERAQDLMYQAWAASGRQRVRLARQALEISEDCADAYVLLAEETTRNAQEAKELYEKGVRAGERALGPAIFEEAVGDFWTILETRPYMRARAGLAECLWSMGESKQAIEHWMDILRLNPNDNQGVRFTLLDCLVTEGDEEALGKLLNQYKDDISASWLYTRALWMFRREGISRKATEQLRKALEANPFVPIYLLGGKKMPKRLPAYIGIGDKTEAIDYVAGAAPAWYETEGAIDWMLQTMEQMLGRPL